MSKAEKYQRKLKKELAHKASFMNTSKWKALFLILKNTPIPLECSVKLLLDTTIRPFSIPNPNNLINEKYIEEYWGVFELKEIEWLLLSSKTPSETFEEIEKRLSEGKQFEYETSETGLKIYGYK